GTVLPVRTASTVSFMLLLLGACKTGGDGGSTLVDRGVCDTLIECASELAPQSRDQFIAIYGEGGTCWQGAPSQWALCRDACRDSLDALNLVGQATGQTCGSCSSDADCSGAVCENGLCVGGEVSDETSADESSADQADETEEDTDTSGCYPPHEICLRFIDCIGQVSPDQHASVQEMYGEGGECWCNDDAQAEQCYSTCVNELEKAIDAFPTAQMCHESWCP